MIAEAPDVEPFDRWADTYDTSMLQRLYFIPIHSAMLDLFADTDASRDMVIPDVGDAGGGTWGSSRTSVRTPRTGSDAVFRPWFCRIRSG